MEEGTVIESREPGAASKCRRTRRLRRIGWALLVIALVVGADQITKLAARRHLEGRGTVHVVGQVLVLRYVENQGAFLSLGAGWPAATRFLIFTVATSMTVVALAGYLFASRSLDGWHRLALACIIGGGVGNLIDRIAYQGSVIDFMHLGVGRLRTGIFNAADLAVLAGAVLLLAAPLRRQRDTASGDPQTHDGR